MKRSRIALYILTALIISCGRQENGKVVARVYESYLYQKDLTNAVPEGLNDVDSIKRADLYVNNWVREQVVLHQANLNLEVDEQTYEERLNSYKNELIIYDYQNELIQQKLNATVTDEEALAYYNENSDNYILRNHVVKVKYAIFEEGTDELRPFGRWMRGDENDENIENFCRDFALLYNTDTTKWQRLEEITGIIPFEVNRMNALVKSKRYEYLLKDKREYFVRIVDSRLVGEVAPFELVRNKVESTVINKRKTDLLKKMREDLFKESISKGELEIFK